MKCDEFLPAFAAGGMIRRAQANFHAGRCTRCAAVRERFLEVQGRWAHPSAVTAAHREMWERAATAEPLPATSKVALVPRSALAAAAMLLVIVTALILTRWPHRPAMTDIAQDQLPSEAVKSPSQQPPHDPTTLDSVEHALDQLAIELKELGNKAALIDARHDVDHLLITYKPLGSSEQSQSDAN